MLALTARQPPTSGMNFSHLTEPFFFGTNPGCKACEWVCNTKAVSRGCEAPTLNFSDPTLVYIFSSPRWSSCGGRASNIGSMDRRSTWWQLGRLALTHSPNAYLLFSLATQNSINGHVWISGYNLWVRKVKLTRFIPNWLRKDKGLHFTVTSVSIKMTVGLLSMLVVYYMREPWLWRYLYMRLFF